MSPGCTPALLLCALALPPHACSRVEGRRAAKGALRRIAVSSCSSVGYLEEQLALDAAQHLAECAAGFHRWPTIADAVDEETSLRAARTTPHSVHSDSVVSPRNTPFLTRELVRMTEEPVLAAEECAAIVREAEARGEAVGWQSRFTLQASSSEVLVSHLPLASTILASALPRVAALAATLLPGIHPSDLRVYNAIVVRYDAARGLDHMPGHGDFSLLR
ncbi:hypothetical protein T492DRAFT_289632 [Pavlovales sp. CCMP2436]|nr:hypothetical protein T492DRAFT_289632 [Pavlovales sp. CCMP2436]